MRSQESSLTENIDSQRDPNGTLVRFENTILESLEKLNSRGFSYAQKKAVVRVLCLKNCNELGLTKEEAQQAAMYFFRLLNEDPNGIHVIWQNLHELYLILQSERTEETENKIVEIVDRLLALNKGGLTLFWRLLHSIVKGDFDIRETVINKESIFYISIPDDDIRRNRNLDTDRQKTASLIKEKVKERIIEKPLPELPDSIKYFNQKGQEYLRKIVVFLQQDADLLVVSSEWRKLIQKYFDDVAGFLIKSVSNISLEANRSGARKNRYTEYVNAILTGYLEKLLEYCLQMTDSKEKNEFAADAILEPSLINPTNILKNGIEEPEIRVIAQRWQKLMSDLQRVIGDDATRMDIPILRPEVLYKGQDDGMLETGVQGLNPDEFREDPSSVSDVGLIYPRALSGEVRIQTPKAVQALTQKAAVTATRINVTGTEKPKDAWDSWIKDQEPDKPKLPKIDGRNVSGTMLGLPTIQGVPGVDPFGATVAVTSIKTNDRAIEVDYIQFYDALTGDDKEKADAVIKRNITTEILYLKTQILEGRIDLKGKPITFILNKIYTEICRRYVLSDKLRRHFITECMLFYNDINKEQKIDNATKEYIYSTMSLLLCGLFPQIDISYELMESLGREKGGIPESSKIAGFVNLPQLDEFPLLSKELSEDDPTLAEIRNFAKHAVTCLKNFNYYFESLAKISDGKSQDNINEFNSFIGYFKSLSDEYERMQAMIAVIKKKTAGGFFRRLFGDKMLRTETNEYFDALSKQIEWLWQEGIKPSLQFFGCLILGEHKSQTPELKVSTHR